MKCIYYILNFTWGILMNIVGAAITLMFAATGKEVKENYGGYYVTVGKDWGGLSLGIFAFTDNSENELVLQHEFGHSFQNAIWGPLFLLVIQLPSAIRYWYIQLLEKQGKKFKGEYDDIWFEGQATRWGKLHARFWS